MKQRLSVQNTEYKLNSEEEKYIFPIKHIDTKIKCSKTHKKINFTFYSALNVYLWLILP